MGSFISRTTWIGPTVQFSLCHVWRRKSKILYIFFFIKNSFTHYVYVFSNQGEHIAFTLYKKNNNSCRRNAMGTYKTTIPYFLRSYIKQMKKEYEAKGAEYEVEEEALEFLECQQYYYNNQMVRS